MRRILTFVLASATVAAAAAQSPAVPRHELENLAALTRLYGIVRYFYPSDAAAGLDWDRFAVLCVSRVRAAQDTAALDATLEELFAPLGPGIIISATLPAAPSPGPMESSPVAWQYTGPGITPSTAPTPYTSRRTNRAPATAAGADQFVTLMQNLPAAELKGKAIRLRGRVRVADPKSPGWAGLWLRVDRANKQIGFFDNMQNRPVRETQWREYVIEGTVADDAENIAFGVLASGPMTADFDRIDLEVGNGSAWTPLAIRDAGFERPAGDSSWLQAGSAKTAQIARLEQDAVEGRQFLRICATSPGSSTAANAVPTPRRHVDFELTAGLRARVPLLLSDAEARTESSALQALRTAIAPIAAPAGRSEVEVRLADVMVAWNVYRHFYPYWTEAGVDWDARLRPQLESAYTVSTRAAHQRILQQLVADVRDGHGTVNDVRREPPASLPVQLRVVDNRVVVTASTAPEAPLGAVVVSIDGVAAAERIAEEMRLASGTTQWKEVRAAGRIVACPRASVVRMIIETAAAETREITLSCNAPQPPLERRPDSIAELTAGIWYVDLTRATMAQVKPALQSLAGATGIVFDIRGYPTDAGSQILPYLVAADEDDRWMHIANIIGPFGEMSGWQRIGWNVRKAAPRLLGRRAFLTDGRAISYAESVLGYVSDHKLGTIIGSATAGTNGNVVPFTVPGGFAITFTGMRVTGHDGQRSHHLIGVQPDIPLEPTLAGVREGRDELLERAIAVIRGTGLR